MIAKGMVDANGNQIQFKPPDWELILDKTLPAQSSDGTLLNVEDLVLDGTYK